MTGYEGWNVIARLERSNPDAPVPLLNGHVDTVELAGDVVPTTVVDEEGAQSRHGPALARRHPRIGCGIRRQPGE
jgi:hypothetical protein